MEPGMHRAKDEELPLCLLWNKSGRKHQPNVSLERAIDTHAKYKFSSAVSRLEQLMIEWNSRMQLWKISEENRIIYRPDSE